MSVRGMESRETLGARRPKHAGSGPDAAGVFLQMLVPICSGYLVWTVLHLLSGYAGYVPFVGFLAPHSWAWIACVGLLSLIVSALCLVLQRRVHPVAASAVSGGVALALRTVSLVWGTLAGKVTVVVAALLGVLVWFAPSLRNVRSLPIAIMVAVACSGLASVVLVPVGTSHLMAAPQLFATSYQYAGKTDEGVAEDEGAGMAGKILEAAKGDPSARDCAAVMMTPFNGDIDCTLMKWEEDVLMVNSAFATAYTDEELAERTASMASDPDVWAVQFTRWAT